MTNFIVYRRVKFKLFYFNTLKTNDRPIKKRVVITFIGRAFLTNYI